MTHQNGTESLSDTGGPAHNGNAAISVKSLWKVFGKDPHRVFSPEFQDMGNAQIQEKLGCVIALQDAGFDVARGETFVVMGLSGSGKSTLVRCLIRLIEPTAGEISIDHQDILQYSQKQLTGLRRHKVAMVFQHYGLLPHKNVIDNAAWGLEVRGEEKGSRYARTQEILDLVGLQGWEQSYPHELSGGMQQRVGLARALAVDPDILLMDEPFSGLDPLIRANMQDELVRLQQDLHKTIVFITHDLVEALKIGDRIAIMRDGQIVQTGTPEEIVLNPDNEYVGEFVRGVSKTRVMGAARIMEGPSTEDRSRFLTYPCCGPTTPVDDLVPMAAQSESPIAVVGEGGALVGVVTRSALLTSLADSLLAQSQQDGLDGSGEGQPGMDIGSVPAGNVESRRN
ncbi:MAG: hypothetical protein BZY88_06255 [SAR202 cluster bacterium Io17-Chloro-G9]|nr:MAG: hypothetical protein BZY88_06255 [SAR202 cluster bacterium Io17-Chloro-G9]